MGLVATWGADLVVEMLYHMLHGIGRMMMKTDE